MTCPAKFFGKHLDLRATFTNASFFTENTVDKWRLEDFIQWKQHNYHKFEEAYLLLKEYHIALNNLKQVFKQLDPALKPYIAKLAKDNIFKEWWELRRPGTSSRSTTIINNRNTSISSASHFTVTSAETINTLSSPVTPAPQSQKQQEQEPQQQSPSPPQRLQQSLSPEPQQQQEQVSQTTRSHDDADDRESTSTDASRINLSYPSSVGRFYVDGIDITLALYKIQQHTLNHTIDSKLYWESHIHHLLSLSSILLVTPGRMHKDVRDILGDDGVDALQSHLAARFGSDDCEFPMDLTFKISSIVKKVEKGKLERDDAVMELLSLKKRCANDLEFKVVKSIRSMIECLPNAVVNEKPNELELLSRYLNAILFPLFDDPQNGILFRWHDTMNHEANKASASISRCRPDSSIAVFDGYSIDYSRGFGEVKSDAQSNHSAAIGKDLVRIGLFAKNAIDVDNMDSILTFHATGRHITFYLVKLMAYGLYIMYELRSIVAPGSIHQILDLLGHLDDLMFILQVYTIYCHPMSAEQVEQTKNMKRNTLSTPEFDRILDKTNKRPCITKRSH